MASYVNLAGDELRRLSDGPAPSETPIGLVDFIATCRGDAESVLLRTKEVLRAVLSQSPEAWPSDEEWPKLLPGWFVDSCVQELTPEEKAAWLAHWKSLPYEEKLRYEDNSWSLLGWVYWFQPEQRSWRWWDAVIESADALRVQVEVEGDPFPSGSLEWVLKAAGATNVRCQNALVEVVSRVINLLDACGDQGAAWFRERLEVLRQEPVASERFQGVVREIKGILAGGMGSFLDISLSPGPDSGLSKRDARMLQWDLVNELDRAIADVLIPEPENP